MKKMKRIDTAADAVAMGTEAPERQEEALRLRAALEKGGESPAVRRGCLYAERVQRTPGGNLSPGLRQSNPYHKKRLSKNGEAFFFAPLPVFDKIRQIVTRRSTAQKWAAGGRLGAVREKRAPSRGSGGRAGCEVKIGRLRRFSAAIGACPQ